MKESGYRGEYCCVYPVKVNQQRQVVEEVLQFGRPYRFGGSAYVFFGNCGPSKTPKPPKC